MFCKGVWYSIVNYLKDIANYQVSVGVIGFFNVNFKISVVFFPLPLKMAGKMYWFNNPRDVEKLQQMLVKSDDENDGVECENESDLEDEDYVEVHSEDSILSKIFLVKKVKMN